MLSQILIGSVLIFATVFVQAASISALNAVITRFSLHMTHPISFLKSTILLSFIVLWLVIGLVITCWLWAGLYLYVDALPTLEESLYFSIVTFATLGYGDVVLNEQWRMLSSITALNGLILLGVNTAYLAQVLSDYRSKQQNSRT
ncbi:ion channel [Ningiella sp. W23]|uniref:ion channel n=1 Tax=Ningiella sp. W23 TaxID=3023715 RepID=UPI003757BBE8